MTFLFPYVLGELACLLVLLVVEWLRTGRPHVAIHPTTGVTAGAVTAAFLFGAPLPLPQRVALVAAMVIVPVAVVFAGFLPTFVRPILAAAVRRWQW